MITVEILKGIAPGGHIMGLTFNASELEFFGLRKDLQDSLEVREARAEMRASILAVIKVNTTGRQFYFRQPLRITFEPDFEGNRCVMRGWARINFLKPAPFVMQPTAPGTEPEHPPRLPGEVAIPPLSEDPSPVFGFPADNPE